MVPLTGLQRILTAFFSPLSNWNEHAGTLPDIKLAGSMAGSFEAWMHGLTGTGA